MVVWESLNHAYGNAGDIPALLAQLANFPPEASYQDEPWYTLWSSLCHQGDIYTASFAAVPEIVKHLASAPERATASFFCLPAAIEVARAKHGLSIPEELEASYFAALRQLGALAGQAPSSRASEPVAQGAIAALAAALGQHDYAELVLSIPKEELPEVMEWYWER